MLHQSDARFSAEAIGIISNHGSEHFFNAELECLLGLGIKHFIYLGPLYRYRSYAFEAIKLMNSVPIKWVYGKRDTVEQDSIAIELPPGDEEFSWHGILFRYFLRSFKREWWELEDEQWFSAEVVLGSLAHIEEPKTVVIGSGGDFQHWVWNFDTRSIVRRNYERHYIGPIDLDPGHKHIIVHPTLRAHRCSVIDPLQNQMVILNF